MDINRPRKWDGKGVHVGQLSTHCESANLHQNMHSHKTIRQASDVLVAQDVEISALKDQLMAVQSLEVETKKILKDLDAVRKRSRDMERRTQQLQDQSSAETPLYHQLRDALERNQQWQAYEQQREGYVKGLLARVSWLEEKLNQAKEALSRHKEAHSEEIKRRVQEMQEHYDKLLHNGSMQRDQLREQVSKAQQHMTDMQRRSEAAERQVEELEQRAEAERLQHGRSIQGERRRWGLKEEQLRAELQEERTQAQELRSQAQELEAKTQELQEERRLWGLREEQLRREVQELHSSLDMEACRAAKLRAEAQEEKRRWDHKEEQLRAEAQGLHSSLEMEARRAAQLTQQVNVLQVNHEEDQRRIVVLEKQLETSSKAIEDERRECQSLQKQLHKVLKNLQRSSQHVAQHSQKEYRGATAAGSDEARLHNIHRPKPSMRSVPSSSLSPRGPDLLDETLLECPGCLALYPASQHAELLAHLEHCVD